MLNLGAWAEFVLILILGLVIIGPKDLVKVLHTLGQWAGKLQEMRYKWRHAFVMLTEQTKALEKEEVRAEKALPSSAEKLQGSQNPSESSQ